MDLAQHYTKETFSKVLINNLTVKNPKSVLEIGAGKGSLLIEAQKKWNQAKFYAMEIDKKNIIFLRNNISNGLFYKINGLHPKLPERTNVKINSIDIAICNPPYIKINNSIRYTSLLKKLNFEDCINLPKISSEVLFLVQNLNFLKRNGELGIILSDTVITSQYYRPFRNSLLENYAVKGIIQLPDKIFAKTEARTHILLLKNSNIKQPKIPISYSNEYGDIKDVISVDRDELKQRMDYTFFQWTKSNDFAKKKNTIGNLGGEIKRGRLSKKLLTKLNLPFFHTSSFNSKIKSSAYPKNRKFSNKHITAKKGDILIARVGSRCIGRVTVLKEREIVISDCVFLLRVQKKYTKNVLDCFLSSRGQAWFKAHSHGVCSKSITKADLLNFPIWR